MGDYELLSEIGRGGMGVVFRARDVRTGGLVALKLVHPDALEAEGAETPEQTLRRFFREARSAGKLDHPGIVRIHEVGSSDRFHYLCMDLVEGRDFGRLLRPAGGAPRLPVRRAIEILRDVALALGHAHSRGIVHRDLKPENVLVAEDGRILLTDFGLAKDLSGNANSVQTGAGVRLGTPQYMSPEQVRCDKGEIGKASDFWAIGVMLYEALAGTLPFHGKTMLSIFDAIRKSDPVPPCSLQPDAPREAEKVCLRCLQKAPALRYGSAEALAADLETVLAGRVIPAVVVSDVPPPDARTGAATPEAGGLAVGPSGRFRTVLLRPGSLVPDRVRRTAWFLFLATLFSTVLCVLAGTLLFAEAGGLIAVSLLAFSMQEELVGVLEENRDVIWVMRMSPWKANTILAAKLVALFFGIFLGFGLMTLLLSESSVTKVLGPQLARYAAEHTRIQGVSFGTPQSLFAHNALVFIGCFLFAFLFRTGGALLVIGWNASVWGAVYGWIVRTQPSGRFEYGAKLLSVVAPHVCLEAAGYVLAALAAIFVSKAMAKYGLETSTFRKVAWAGAQLLLLGVALLGAAAYVEAVWTPQLARFAFG